MWCDDWRAATGPGNHIGTVERSQTDHLSANDDVFAAQVTSDANSGGTPFTAIAFAITRLRCCGKSVRFPAISACTRASRQAWHGGRLGAIRVAYRAETFRQLPCRLSGLRPRRISGLEEFKNADLGFLSLQR
jgi:hypothetical protein